MSSQYFPLGYFPTSPPPPTDGGASGGAVGGGTATCPEDALLAAVASTVTGLGLTLGGSLIPVKALKEPRLSDWTAPPVFICCPAEGGEWSRAMQGNTFWVPYGIDVVLLAAGNRDLVTNISSQLGWRWRTKKILADPTGTGLTYVAGVKVNEDPPFDRSQIPDGNDVSVMRFVFTVLEDH